MKVEIIQEKPVFTPIVIKITMETEQEAHLWWNVTGNRIERHDVDKYGSSTNKFFETLDKEIRDRGLKP